MCDRWDVGSWRRVHDAVGQVLARASQRGSARPHYRYCDASRLCRLGRREFVTLLGGAAAVWPFAARGQPALPTVGFLRSATLADVPHWVTAFRQGLKEAGFIEGQNVAIEYRSADNQPDRLPALATDLIRQPVAVIVGNTDSALAAKAATTTVPIVFATGSDPVRLPRRQARAELAAQ